MSESKKIPRATITRLCLYYRQLEMLEFDGYRIVSSNKLAWLTQTTPAQVRKDLGYFGEFGVRGQGYDVIELQRKIKEILALNRPWYFAVIGVGNLGKAIINNQNLKRRGFVCVAAFDIDPQKIGTTAGRDVWIMHIDRLPNAVKERQVDIGVITTPPRAAQKVADLLVQNGIHAIVNFSPTRIILPECCVIDNIDFSVTLDVLSYKAQNRHKDQIEVPH